MNESEFRATVQKSVIQGAIFQNPGGGHSRVKKIDDEAITYIRGKSSIRVTLSSLFRAYDHFVGQRVTSSQLRKFAPEVFDSSAWPSGHSCNCTFFFKVLQVAGLASDLEGKGVKGKPYSVVII